MERETELLFGPVPSRRLGRSLGVNLVPPKHCTYACIYCQIGPTTDMTLTRRSFHDPSEVVDAVRNRLAALAECNEPVDYVTLLADGEPTLEEGLGEILAGLESVGVPTAVITNGSLLYNREVRAALSHAAWVSVKVDAVEDRVWRHINRPHRSLRLVHVMAGIRQFADEFGGTLVTETMLVAGKNDEDEHLRGVARYVAGLKPATSFLAIPTRPPAVQGVRGPDEDGVVRAYGIFSERLPSVELLTGSEGDEFSGGGDPRSDILAITAVHPMRKSAVRALLERSGADWSVVESLIEEGLLTRADYENEEFYTRRLS